MMKRNSYSSINNSYVHGYDDYMNYRDSACSRIPCAIIIPLILFAAFVGHIATLAFLHEHGDIGPQLNSLGSTAPITLADIKAAQKYANAQLKENLLEPCQEAEEYYNQTANNKVIMSSSGKNNNTDSSSAPPLPPPPEGCLATIMLFRHCEAGVAREHCGYMGDVRSEYIATLFGNTPDARWPVPDVIYAMAAGERHNQYVENYREIETFDPLSKKVNVEINEKYGFPEKKKFVEHLYSKLRTGELCGKLVVISWKHHDIPHFSQSLGCGPDDGCPMAYGEYDYEAVWQLTFSYHKEKYAPYVVEDNSKHGMREKMRKKWGLYPQWFVYGTIQHEDFDPLAFAKAGNGSA